MNSTPQQSIEEAEANSTFDALLWAMSAPGMIRQLPAHGELPVVRALLDREVKANASDTSLTLEIIQCGAQITGIGDADYVFFGDMVSSEPLRSVKLGSDLHPEHAATLIVRAQLTQGETLELSGPGIEHSRLLQIGGLPGGFWQLRRSLIRYPMGFDLLLVDGDCLVGIPRSTCVETA